MSPDTLESRFAALRQQVQDLIEREAERYRDLGEDMRAMAKTVARLETEARALHRRLDDAEVARREREEKRERDRQAQEENRKKERQAGRRLALGLYIAAAGVLGSVVIGLANLLAGTH